MVKIIILKNVMVELMGFVDYLLLLKVIILFYVFMNDFIFLVYK